MTFRMLLSRLHYLFKKCTDLITSFQGAGVSSSVAIVRCYFVINIDAFSCVLNIKYNHCKLPVLYTYSVNWKREINFNNAMHIGPLYGSFLFCLLHGEFADYLLRC